jgi:hypothetical protein
MKCNLGGRSVLFEYQVKSSPNLTCHTQAEKDTLRQIVRKNKAELEDVFDNFIYFEGYVYSFERIDDASLPQD